MLILLSNFNKNHTEANLQGKTNRINIADNFVKSVADASATVLSICGFVILFSVVNGYLNYFAENVAAVKTVGLILEITNAVTLTNNVYVISFLLGFGGISVWCQVLSVAGKIKINFLKFLIFRILHGALSACITAVLLRLFPVNVLVFSNVKTTLLSYFYSTAAVGISLVCMGMVFVISVTSKKYVGKITEDMV